MSKTEETAIQTLNSRCDTIAEVLGRANGIAARLVEGPLEPKAEEAEGFDCPLKSVSYKLKVIQGQAESVLDYLLKMEEMI